ncbi:MAG: hypothetical protein GY870_11490, partial [archaeon]|nr:hypothetical protein [archaeon]
WGVNFLEINGTTYPFDEMNMRSMWGWYDGGLDTEQMRTFADKPTEVSIENLRLSVHFQGESDKESEEANFETSIKIDQEIGNWNTDIRGGRENFENYSLSLSYYVYSIAWRSDTISEEDFEYSEEGKEPPPEGEEGKEPPPEGSAGVLEVQEELRAIEVTLGSAQDGEDGEGTPPDGEGPPPDGEDGGEGGGYEGGGSGEGDSVVLDDDGNEVDNDAQTLSENYSMVESSASGVFAKAELGSAYTWDKNKSMSLNVSSFTAPISTFKGAFSSGDSGKSCTNFAFQGELYFLSVGFSKWDGYAVYNDPTFTSFVGATEHEFGPGDSSSGGMDFLLPAIAIGAACIVGVIFIILKKRKGGGGGDFNIEPTF